MATHGALLVTASRAHRAATSLLMALERNRETGIAIGVLMARDHLTRDQAFDVLWHASQNSNRKLRDLAAEVVDTGLDPRASSPSGSSGAADTSQE